jgi:outer membrane receptor protein involved in Fe transport
VSFYAVNGTPPRNPSLPSDAVLFLNGRSGNPDLDPYRATNYNASWEWYFADASLISVGAFLIDVKSFPTTVTNIEPLPDVDGVVRAGGPVERLLDALRSQGLAADPKQRKAMVPLTGLLGVAQVDVVRH